MYLQSNKKPYVKTSNEISFKIICVWKTHWSINDAVERPAYSNGLRRRSNSKLIEWKIWILNVVHDENFREIINTFFTWCEQVSLRVSLTLVVNWRKLSSPPSFAVASSVGRQQVWMFNGLFTNKTLSVVYDSLLMCLYRARVHTNLAAGWPHITKPEWRIWRGANGTMRREKLSEVQQCHWPNESWAHSKSVTSQVSLIK